MQAVQANAHAAHVVVDLWVQHGSWRVVAVDQARLQPGVAQGRNRLVEALALHLEVPVARNVRRGEMRERSGTLNATVEVYCPAELHGIRGQHANARHARVHGKVVFGNLVVRRGTLAQRQRELLRVHGGHDVELDELLDALQRRLREDEDGLADSRLAQGDALLHVRHRKLVRTRPQHLARATHGAMAIGVRLDHAHHLDAPLQTAPEGLRVVPHGVQVNLHPRPASLGTLSHWHLLASYCLSGTPSGYAARSSRASAASPTASIMSVAMTPRDP